MVASPIRNGHGRIIGRRLDSVAKSSTTTRMRKRDKLSIFLISLLLFCSLLVTVRQFQLHRDDSFPLSFTPEVDGGIAPTLEALGAHSTLSSSLSNLNGKFHHDLCRPRANDSVATIHEDLVFWWEGQPRLCDLIRQIKGVRHIQDPGRPMVLNLALNCTEISHNNNLGSGNWLVGFYMTLIAATFAGVRLDFQCSAGNYKSEILPWLQGCYQPNTEAWPPNNASERLVCSWAMTSAPVNLAALEIRAAMRHIVRSATGYERPPLSVPVNTTLFGEVLLDQVAIHFRCGDILHQHNPRGDYGFLRYPEYRKRIPRSATSIGIITQPFEKSRNRVHDQEHTEVCRQLVHLLVNRLQRDFPKASVNVRNGQKETITLAYIRLAVAEQTIIGLSSFGAFPILANFGTNYFLEGRMLVNQWLNSVPNIMGKMIVMKDAEFLRNKHIMKKGINFTLSWFSGPN